MTSVVLSGPPVVGGLRQLLSLLCLGPALTVTYSYKLWKINFMESDLKVDLITSCWY